MKVLIVAQNSELSTVLSASRSREKGYHIWNDTKLPVSYPVAIGEVNRRGKTYVKGKVTWTKTFNQLCEMFPYSVKELPEGTKAYWGTGLYVESPDGFPTIMDSDWDSSD